MNLFSYVTNNPLNWVDPWGVSKWKKIPGHPDWEVRHDQPHHNKDYTHDHYRKRGKDYRRKVDPKTGKQKNHGKKGEDKDVPKDVIDSGSRQSDTDKKGSDKGDSKACKINFNPPDINPWWVIIPILVSPFFSGDDDEQPQYSYP